MPITEMMRHQMSVVDHSVKGKGQGHDGTWNRFLLTYSQHTRENHPPAAFLESEVSDHIIDVVRRYFHIKFEASIGDGAR